MDDEEALHMALGVNAGESDPFMRCLNLTLERQVSYYLILTYLLTNLYDIRHTMLPFMHFVLCICTNYILLFFVIPRAENCVHASEGGRRHAAGHVARGGVRVQALRQGPGQEGHLLQVSARCQA